MKKFRPLETFQTPQTQNIQKESFKRLPEKNNLEKIQNYLTEIKQKQDKLFFQKIHKDIQTIYKKENYKNSIFIDISLFISEEINDKKKQKNEKIITKSQNEKKILKTIQNIKKEEIQKKLKNENSTLSSQKKIESQKEENSEIPEIEELVIKKLGPLEESKLILGQVRKIKNYWFGFTQTHPFIFKKCRNRQGLDYCEESKDFSNKTLYKLK